MVIVGIADTHGDVRALGRMGADLAAADVVALAGDITTFGNREDAARVVEAIRRRCRSLVTVPGNCDPPEVAEYLEENGIGLHARNQTVDGVAFVGLGGSLPCLGRTVSEYTEEQLQAFLARAARGAPPDAPVVLVSHEPPYNTAVDNAHHGGHAGSVSVRSFIERCRPLLCLCGHIHESRGIDTIGSTKIVNPGPFREGTYMYAEITDKVEVLEIRSC